MRTSFATLMPPTGVKVSAWTLRHFDSTSWKASIPAKKTLFLLGVLQVDTFTAERYSMHMERLTAASAMHMSCVLTQVPPCLTALLPYRLV
jgi:hypothetical protein